MAGVPVIDPYLTRFWQQVCDIAVDYGDVQAINDEAKARYKLINVLWDSQRDELLSMVAGAMVAGNVIIDAVRGLTPRPTLLKPVLRGERPIYPLEFVATPNYEEVINFSYLQEDFNPPVTPPAPLPDWWYIGANLYRMILRANDYLTIPVEPVSGVTLGVWGASTWYGVIALQLLYNDYATAKNTAHLASAQLVSVLNEKSRKNR
jgi:hypothetical protein